MKPKYQFLGIGHHHHHLHDHHQHHHHHHHHAISGSGREVESECREDGSWSQVEIFLIVLVITLFSILKYGQVKIRFVIISLSQFLRTWIFWCHLFSHFRCNWAVMVLERLLWWVNTNPPTHLLSFYNFSCPRWAMRPMCFSSTTLSIILVVLNKQYICCFIHYNYRHHDDNDGSSGVYIEDHLRACIIIINIIILGMLTIIIINNNNIIAC